MIILSSKLKVFFDFISTIIRLGKGRLSSKLENNRLVPPLGVAKNFVWEGGGGGGSHFLADFFPFLPVKRVCKPRTN